MKITVIIENTVHKEGLHSEHGLSLLIESKGERILFDTGQSAKMLENADRLGVDFKRLTNVVISHGHYDHTGVLMEIMRQLKCPIYIQRSAFRPFYSCYKDCKYIGIDKEMDLNEHLKILTGNFRISERMLLINEVEQGYPLPSLNRYLYVKSLDTYQADTFLHEQSLVIEEDDRLYLLSGCSHRGILNIIAACHKEFGRYPDVVIGGFHLSSENKQMVDDEIAYITKELCKTPCRFISGHCTGPEGFEYLKKHLGERIQALHTGDIIEI